MRGNLLSKVGKEILIKTVVQSIPIYFIGYFKLPKQLIFKLNKMITTFWWSANGDKQGLHWINWDKLYGPKTEVASIFYP